jgi:3'-phosphoadenosine 5'-phosphosulfate sulfotransferase (PAPS reductase)/FAD synthetase
MPTMGNPFAITGPALISFSGGRTSGYMLRRILDAGLGDECFVVFANTGKERPETLAFVREVSRQWGVKIHWVEMGRGEIEPETASVNGEPFEALITKKKHLPFPRARFCTSEMKIEPMAAFMRARGHEWWTNVAGIRADEPNRVARMMAPDEKNERTWDNHLPLARAGVSVADVTAFWMAQPFDLQLRPGEGNCDMCFLKGKHLRMDLMRRWPDASAWWIEQERRIGATFRSDTHDYAALQDAVNRSPQLPWGCAIEDDPSDLGDCVCHD